MATVEHAQVTGEAIDEVVNTVVDAEASVAPTRHFTVPGIDPFDAIEWELRDAHIPGKDGPTFEQRDVEFPRFWSQTATNIVAQKYFRGRMASPERERSVKQMIGRVVDTIGGWGREGGYFATDEEAETFEAELKAILVNQYASFNSPVWFNVGFEASPQCSACQPWRARVSTPEGMVPIGQLVEEEQIGREVYDANGTTRIVAVKANGLKEVFRVTLRNGSFVEATGDHVVKAVHSRRSQPAWLRVDELRPGMRMHLHPHRAKVVDRALVPAGGGTALLEDESSGDPVAIAQAALAGWLQADGFVGQYEQGTNRSLTLEFQVANEDEYRWVVSNLDLVFPNVHRHVRDVATQDTSLRCRRIRLYGEELRDFVDRWQLLLRGTAIRVPEVLWTASRDEILAYLRSIFQADGYVSVRHDNGNENARIGFAVVGERWAEDVQLLLNLVGIYSRRTHKPERRENRHDLHEVSIAIGSERARFAELVGFVGADKQQKLLESLVLRGLKACPDLREEEIVSIEPLGVEDVYDIQTESGEYLSNNVAVHNCFILSIDDSMESILDWIRREGIIFRGGSGSGLNLSRLRSSKEQLSKGGYASGPVSFMRGADASAGTIKSGGKTRRAAKMVVLDVDHPDVEEFIWCKAKEERKARVLEAAGYDMSLNSADWASIQYQNANNSVRVTDGFMEAVIEGKEWNLTARTDGSVVETRDARDLLRQIAEAAWECADPGVQYDTTINAWHTLPNTGRINASNPCFPGDARVHTTLGLLRFEELYERWLAGEDFRVYTHRATAAEPGPGVVATTPITVMKNGVKPILRLRFANGQELRCTRNHRIWTLNRGYVEACELTSEDRILLNDAATPATDASWMLPVKVEMLAKSASRGGTAVYRKLPDRWTEGLAELTGHLIGDGCLTDAQTQWIYGADDVADGLSGSHEGMLRELIEGISVQRMPNETLQLRAGSTAVRELFRGLGVTSRRAHEKRVPASIFTAPVEVQAAFLRGLFGADGCVSRVENGKANRYAGLGSRSEALLKDVQRLLNGFGVRCRIYEITGSNETKFTYTRADGTEVEYTSRQGFDLRITGSDLSQFASAVGFSAPRKQAALAALVSETTRYATKPGTTLVSRDEDGQEAVYNLTEPLHHSYIVDGVVVANCSEYMSIDDSACNLASLNLMKFRREDGEFDVEAFEHAVDVVFLAQEIAVGYSSYPTPEIGRNAKAFRQLGLGYANLGALLMARGLPYDSDEGRAYAAAITALMTGRAYRKSAEVARRMGPFAGYQPNAAAMTGVIAKHRAAVGNIDHAHSVPDDLLSAARRAWDDALSLGEVSGFRNAQATVLAPTGCLVGDSLVSTSRGLVRLRTLGDPVGEKWQDLDVQVTTDEGARDATQFYVNGFEQIVSIETGRGYRIQGTPTHRIKVVDASGEWQWRRFAEIREGDRVPLMLNGMVGDPQTVELPPLGDLYWTADFRSRVPRQMTTELAELVGYFMGDGSLHAKGLRFCVAREDEDVVEHLVDLIASLFGLDAATSDKGGYTEVSVNSVPLVLWWEACGFAKLPPSAERSGKGWHAHIPDAVLHTNDREVYAAFIRGLFEADGTTANGYVSWSTVTETFSRDVQTMLLALGFVTTRKVDLPSTNWGANSRFVLRLLNVAASEQYLEEIDFISARKAGQLWKGEHRQASRHDHVPLSRELIDELAPENDGLRKTMLMALARRGDVSRRSATALLERTADPELEHLLGFYYDTVATVETLDDQPTYDISVPDNVTYVANGFISHNTISFMMDCDTTGVEPDFSLVKSKRLVGGGEITIVNKTVPMALAKLGYSPTESDEIVAFIDERNTIVGAPYVKTEHYPVFDCAIGDRAIHYMGHVKMMGAVQPFISGAISKCVVADTLVTSGEGLVRIGSLHHGEAEDSFRSMKLSVASLDGLRTTDAFYYGGERETIEVVLGSGHRIVGTPNHRLLVALPDGGLDWKSLDELEEGDQVATQYGDDVWSERPASFDDFAPSALNGSQKVIRIPEVMSDELAFFLGAYAAEGHTARSNHTVRIASADETVIARLVELVRSLFAIEPRVARFEGKCPSVEVTSKTLVEFLDYLGCGDRARNKRIPNAVLRSPRSMVLAFLEGLSLDSYLPASLPKWAICLASNSLLDDLQAVLTNLGVVHNRITKHNAAYDTSFDEVYAHGRQAQKIASLLRFPEAHKQARAAALLDLTIGSGTSDLVPGIRGSDLYDLIPRGRSGRTGRGTGTSREFSHLVDPRTAQVSRASLEAVATMPGVELPDWLEVVLQQNLHFSPVAVVREAGVREVYDVSVPVTHAFVGNGIVNHNTVNLPEEITVDEISQLLIESWQLGVKAIAIYRDNCKVAQPLSKKGDAGATTLAPVSGVVGALPQRRRLPDDRMEVGRKFKVGEYEGYIHVGLFEDGTPGDIFVDIAKEGTTLAGLMNSFMISVSLGLQYGVPLEVYVSKFSHMRFEPSGMTNDADIRVAKSIVDYIFRWMGKKFLSSEQQEEAGILTPEVKARLAAAYADAGSDAVAAAAVLEPVPPGQTALFNQWEDAQECARCGGRMVRTGSCYTCRDCGTNTGCS